MVHRECGLRFEDSATGRADREPQNVFDDAQVAGMHFAPACGRPPGPSDGVIRQIHICGIANDHSAPESLDENSESSSIENWIGATVK
jgi:hypothetical protein